MDTGRGGHALHPQPPRFVADTQPGSSLLALPVFWVFLINLFIYLFLAALGLRCRKRAFSWALGTRAQ